MKKIYILTLLVALAACSPRVDDIFDNTAVVRLEQNAAEVKERLIAAENGWVMQYFAQADPTSSDVTKHRGYTFLFRFRDDGTVTVGAPVNGMFKTETSMWDIINDNSTVLTFNTFNSIFHYYSNPDPELGLWGADGEGVGGDYEFMVLEYNKEENYQLLKGKKRSCYIRLYPLAANEDWEAYFSKLDKMKEFIFGEDLPLDLYVDSKHFTLYNGPKLEFRVFDFGADTLGGGAYYGFIITENGIRFHDNAILGADIDRASFNLSENGEYLQSVINPDAYISLDGASAFSSTIDHGTEWIMDSETYSQKLVDAIDALENTLKSYDVTKLQFESDTVGYVVLHVVYSNKRGDNNALYYYNKYIENGLMTLNLDTTMSQPNLNNFGGKEFALNFNGTYNFKVLQPFHPSEGLEMRQIGDDGISFTLYK